MTSARQNFLRGLRPSASSALLRRSRPGRSSVCRFVIVAGSESEARRPGRAGQGGQAGRAARRRRSARSGVRRDNGRHRRRAARGSCRPCAVPSAPALPHGRPAIPAEVQFAPRRGRTRKKRFEKNHSPRSSKPTCWFKSANATMTTIPGRLPRVGSRIDGKVLTVTDANGQARWQPRHAGGRGCPCGGEAAAAREEPRRARALIAR